MFITIGLLFLFNLQYWPAPMKFQQNESFGHAFYFVDHFMSWMFLPSHVSLLSDKSWPYSECELIIFYSSYMSKNDKLLSMVYAEN